MDGNVATHRRRGSTLRILPSLRYRERLEPKNLMSRAPDARSGKSWVSQFSERPIHSNSKITQTRTQTQSDPHYISVNPYHNHRVTICTQHIEGIRKDEKHKTQLRNGGSLQTRRSLRVRAPKRRAYFYLRTQNIIPSRLRVRAYHGRLQRIPSDLE